jgi:hypothetical protein
VQARAAAEDYCLVEILRSHRQLAVASLVDVVIRRVAEFSGSGQTDDQTLVMPSAQQPVGERRFFSAVCSRKCRTSGLTLLREG